MNAFSRFSLTSLTCVVLCAWTSQTMAQSAITPDTSTTGGVNNTNGMSTSPSSTTGTSSSSSTSDNTGNGSMQSLPMDPPAAGYTSGRGDTSYSWLPYTTSGYVGLSVGNANLDTDCVPGQNCDNAKGAVHVYTGGMFTPYLGMQLGYFRLGDADRNGGTTKVSGVNLVLTGVAPLSSTFSLIGRVGGTYGWTDTSVGISVPAPSGKKNAFGAAYGAGVSWDFDRNWSLTLDWDRHHLKFAGDQHKNTDVALIGFKYRF